LLDGTNKVPTSVMSRLGRTAFAALKTGRLIKKMGRRSPSEDLSQVDLQRLAGLVSSIGRLKGIAMKMGQIMSYIDVALPEELREALSALQTHAQPMDFASVAEIVKAELPESAHILLESMEPIPLAAASIGQVHRALLPDGTAVAVKVQYPEIADAIESDFKPAAIGPKIASLFYPGAHIEAFIEEARSRFLEECDYVQEATRQNQFHELFSNHPVITVPEAHLA
jgi:predicted unusual protein kinase regulating ubiquinone biosynthesis (AarF/ABC1/UbiB family)